MYGLTEIILLICTSAIWGWFPVFTSRISSGLTSSPSVVAAIAEIAIGNCDIICLLICQERLGFDSWVWKIPWRRVWQPTLVFLPGEFPWTEEPCWLQSIESQRAGHIWSNWACRQLEHMRDCSGISLYFHMPNFEFLIAWWSQDKDILPIHGGYHYPQRQF